MSLKLNKKGDQPVWAFEIRGRVSRCVTRSTAYRCTSYAYADSLLEPQWTAHDHHARYQRPCPRPEKAGGAERAALPPSGREWILCRVSRFMLSSHARSHVCHQIHLVLPNLTDLRNLVSRLGHMADDVEVSANQVSREQRWTAAIPRLAISFRYLC